MASPLPSGAASAIDPARTAHQVCGMAIGLRKVLFLGMGQGYTYDCDVNFYEPLKKIVATINYDYFTRVREIGAHAMNREVLALVDRERPDCVFLHTFRHEVFKGTLREITSRGITTVLWFSDDHWRFDDYTRHFANVITCSVTTDHLSLAKYQALRMPVILSQWASNPDYYHPVAVDRDIDVSFVGARMKPREELVEGLRARGIRVEAFGSGWPNGRVSFDEMVRIFSRSRINLNSSYFWKGSEHPQIKGRVFEIPMSGGFLLTDHAFRLEDYFELDREVVCYRSIDEAADRIRYFLSHETERARIAAGGHRRALRDHTWEVRLRALFEEVERRHSQPPDTTRRTSDRGGHASPSTGLTIGPSRGRILETFVSDRRELVLRTATDARVFVSTDDLCDGLAYSIQAERWLPEAHRHADEVQPPQATCDVVLAGGCLDSLTQDQAGRFWAECSRLLAPGGLLIGSAKLWYDTDADSRAAHRHRGYLEAHSPAHIRAQLRRAFRAVRLVEIHRPMGPLGPFVVFVAANTRTRLQEPDVRGLLTALRDAQRTFGTSSFDNHLTWSAIFHRTDRRASLIHALNALRQKPLRVAGWKAIARALLGRAIWGAFRKLSRRGRHPEHPPGDGRAGADA